MMHILGSTIDSLQMISSFNMEALLLINDIGLLRVLADPSNQRLSISSLFSIEPNMDECKDHLLPEYVGSLTAVHCQWPLLFCLTEDGIVCIHYTLFNSSVCSLFCFLYFLDNNIQ